MRNLSFYEFLKYHTKIFLGDFKAKLGREYFQTDSLEQDSV